MDRMGHVNLHTHKKQDKIFLPNATAALEESWPVGEPRTQAGRQLVVTSFSTRPSGLDITVQSAGEDTGSER